MIVLNDRANYWIDPFTKGLSSGISYTLEDYLKQKALERRAGQIAGLLSQALEDIPSPEQTYVVNQPSFDLKAPTLDLSPVQGVREQISQGLLGEATLGLQEPRQSEFLSVLKDPQEYREELYRNVLPAIASLRAYGVDASSVVSDLVTRQEQAYEQADKQAKELKTKLLRFKKGASLVSALSKKYGLDLDEDAKSALALLYAGGDLKADDIVKIFKGKYDASVEELPDGRTLLMIENKETGEVRTKFINPDLELLKRKENIKAQVKAKAKQRGQKRWQKAKIRVATPEYLEAVKKGDDSRAVKMKIRGRDAQDVVLVFDPYSGKYLTPKKKLEVDINDPYDVWLKLEMDKEGARSVEPTIEPNLFRREVLGGSK